MLVKSTPYFSSQFGLLWFFISLRLKQFVTITYTIYSVNLYFLVMYKTLQVLKSINNVDYFETNLNQLDLGASSGVMVSKLD